MATDPLEKRELPPLTCTEGHVVYGDPTENKGAPCPVCGEPLKAVRTRRR